MYYQEHIKRGRALNWGYIVNGKNSKRAIFRFTRCGSSARLAHIVYALSAWLSDHELRRSEARDNDSSRAVDLVEAGR